MHAVLRRPLLLASACWAAFAGVLAAAYWLPAGRWFDGWAVDGFLGLQQAWLDPWAKRVAHLADPAPFTLIAAALVAIAVMRGRYRAALAVAFLTAGSNVTTQVLQHVLAHPRHHEFLGGAQVQSVAFPSGHATASMSIALAAVLVSPAVARPFVAGAGALFTLAISESIMLLGWHFPSDVLGGYLVATSFACVALAAVGAADARWPARTGRDAARRALGRVALAWTSAAVLSVSAGAGVAAVLLARERVVQFAQAHTTALAAVLGVAALAAALPAAVAGLATRRA
jgi:membrane-associated phospholipid phosphatase